MVNATTRPPRARAQRSASKASARLSGPPDTATAIVGWRSNGPTAAIRRSNSAASSGTAADSAATEPLPFIGHPALQGAGRPGILAIEALIGGARLLDLAQDRQGQTELEQVVGRLRALRVSLVALEELRRSLRVVVAHVVGLAKPVLGVAGERIMRIGPDELAQRLLGLAVFGPLQQVEGVVVLVLGRP